jgi:hypothetical protein
VQRRENWQQHRQDEDRLDDPDEGAEPPRRFAQSLKCRDVNKRENPAVHEMQQKANEFRFVSARCEHSSEQIRNVHSCEA